MNEQNDKNSRQEQDKEKNKVTPSSTDQKNESAVRDTPSATDRVKPRAGDGLANEGTNVSYDEER